MDITKAIVLGVVQGLTEFLPISSSAHLVLVPFFLHWDDPGLAFDVALHLGTLVAVLFYFWKDWLALLQQIFPFIKKYTPQNFLQTTVNWKALALATIPAALAGLVLEEHAEKTFRNPLLIATTLAVFAGLLFYFDRRRNHYCELTQLHFKTALFIGLAQAVAIVPGVSRSGVTITAALALGFTRSAATRFSFLLSAPIIAGAGLLKMNYILASIKAGGAEAMGVGVGFISSFFSGLLAIIFLNLLIRTRSFTGFVVYRIVLAVFILSVFLSK